MKAKVIFTWKNKTKNVFEKAKKQNGQLAPQIFNIFSQKFMDWFLGELERLTQRALTRPEKFSFFFPSSPLKSVKIYRLARIGQNFDDYPGFQPKTTFMYYFAHDCTL